MTRWRKVNMSRWVLCGARTRITLRVDRNLPDWEYRVNINGHELYWGRAATKLAAMRRARGKLALVVWHARRTLGMPS